MPKKLYEEAYIQGIASGIRYANGQSTSYQISAMGSAVRALKKIIGNGQFSSNGSYSASDYQLDAFSNVVVNVQNSFAIEDEGKVVQNGTLIDQESLSISSNGIYDTTSNNSIVVNVSGGGGGILVSKSISQNGTYNALLDDNADGYSEVVVSVNSGDLDELPEYIARTLSVLYNQRVSMIGSYAFYNYGILSQAIFPECTSIGTSAFMNCSALSQISFPKCTTIGSSAFYNCRILSQAFFPECTSIESYAFMNCSALSQASFPKCTTIGANIFMNCSALSQISFPECSNIRPYAFYNCRALSQISLPKCTSIGTSAFYMCLSFESFYLLGSSMVSLQTKDAFSSTPMSLSSYLGRFGSIYVPASLVDIYKSAANWSFYSDRITSYVE